MAKLVRDLLDDRIPAEELRIETDEAELSRLLGEKLREEIAELEASGHADVGEFADVLEVLRTIAARRGIVWASVESARLEKRAERGGFERGLVYAPAAPAGP